MKEEVRSAERGVFKASGRMTAWSVAWLLVVAVAVAGTNEVSRLTEPDRIIRRGDMVKIRVSLPPRDGQFARATASLHPVEKNGEVVTPEGSFVKAAGLTLLGLRTNLAAMYAGVRGYDGAKIEADIWSSPYKVIRYDARRAAAGTNAPPATLHPRIFRVPLTVWAAIEAEGGLPEGVDPRRVCVVRDNADGKAERNILDCGGKDGAPDGGGLLESGDYLFLVPENTPLGKLVE